MLNFFHSLQPIAKRITQGLKRRFDKIGVCVAAEGKTPGQMSEAERVLDLLTATYPGHPWAVRVDGGIIFIRHLAFGLDNPASANWGMNLKTREADHDAAVMRRKIVMLAGEWLERAGLSRSQWFDPETDEFRVEGIPERYQPVNLKRPEKKDMFVPELPERTEPRPQVGQVA